jgi:hypothetical protein
VLEGLFEVDSVPRHFLEHQANQLPRRVAYMAPVFPRQPNLLVQDVVQDLFIVHPGERRVPNKHDIEKHA